MKFLDAIDPTLGIDPILGGKICATAWLTQGLLVSLVSVQQARLYGWPHTNKQAMFLLEMCGAAILATGVVACALQFGDKTVHEAFGFLGVVWAIALVKWYLNDSFKQVGFKMQNVILTAFTTALTIYGGFYDPEWADLAFVIMIGFYTLSALVGLVMPEVFSKFYGPGIKTDKEKYLVRHFNYFFLAQEVQNLCLLQGIAPHKANAFASLCGLFFFWDGIYGSKGIKKYLKPPPGYHFWLCWFSFFCPLIIFKKEAEDVVE